MKVRHIFLARNIPGKHIKNSLRVYQVTKHIELTKELVARVDDEDYEYLAQFKWCSHYGYAARRGPNNTTILMHRVVLGRKIGRALLSSEQCDHIDGNRSNNIRANLRTATRSQNTRNRSKIPGTSSKYIGVSCHKTTKRWLARIRVSGKLIHLGSFRREEQAAIAYDVSAIQYFGEFAKLNHREFSNELSAALASDNVKFDSSPAEIK